MTWFFFCGVCAFVVFIIQFEKNDNGIGKDLDSKLDVFKQFCQECKFREGEVVWNCDKLEISSFNKKEMRDLYSSRWNDFVSIRIDLFDNKLRQLFEKKLNISQEEVDQFYSYFTHYRTLCGVLPVACDGFRMSAVETSDKLVKIHETFLHNKTTSSALVGDISGCLDLSDIYRFMVIWNGVHVLLNKPIRYDRQGPFYSQGLEFKLKEDGIFTEGADHMDNDKLNYAKDRICELACDYITNEFAETNIFGYYVNKTGFERAIFGWVNKNLESIQMAKNAKVLHYCTQMVFDDTFDELKKLIRYCISNISDIDSYKHNINYKNAEKCCYDSGIACFIVNQLAYVVFHDVTMDSLNSKNSSENNKLLFPQLLKASKFLYNTSCFLYCYPFDSDTKESFYLSQYFDLKNALFGDIFDKENKLLSQSASKLSEYNYSRYQCRGDGTILHKACSLQYRGYCDILIKDGFDVNKPNRLNDKWRATPMDIAKTYSSTLMTHLFGVCLFAFRPLFFGWVNRDQSVFVAKYCQKQRKIKKKTNKNINKQKTRQQC